jgi:hypothetical protein
MQSKGRMVVWGVAVVAATAVITTITACTKSESPGGATVTSSKATVQSLSSDQMHSVLVQLSAQPASESVKSMTLKEAANSFPLLPGEVYSPHACISYIFDVVGSFAELDGWIQFGTRTATGREFTQYIVNLPNGASVKAIEASVARCPAGTLTLDDKVTGRITITSTQAPQLAGSETFSIATRMQFKEAKGTEGAAILNKYLAASFSGNSLDPEQIYSNVTDFAANGNTLIVTEEFDQATADQVIGGMVQNLNTVQHSK